MEPLNTLPCVMLPHLAIVRWSQQASAEAFRALVRFASSQLLYGPCLPASDAVRMHCGCSMEEWERIHVEVTRELKMGDEGTYGFDFVETARDKATITGLVRSFVAWRRFNPMWGGTALPRLYQEKVQKLPVALQDAARKALLAVNVGVTAAAPGRVFPPGAAGAKAMQLHGEGGPEWAALVDGMNSPDAIALQQNRTKAGALSGATATTAGRLRSSATPAAAPPSDQPSNSMRNPSSWWPSTGSPRGGPGGGKGVNDNAELTGKDDEPGVPTVHESARARRSRPGGLGVLVPKMPGPVVNHARGTGMGSNPPLKFDRTRVAGKKVNQQHGKNGDAGDQRQGSRGAKQHVAKRRRLPAKPKARQRA